MLDERPNNIHQQYESLGRLTVNFSLLEFHLHFLFFLVSGLLPEIKMKNGLEVFCLTNIRIKDAKYAPNTLPNLYYKFDEVTMLQSAETAFLNSEDIEAGVNRGRLQNFPHLKKQVGSSKVSTVLIQFNF
jgi:hypothetical protein